jgi:hypothetical protein
MTYEEACEQIIRASIALRAKPGLLLHYAAQYARAGRGMTGEARKAQALYILANITNWRGPKAPEVRATLRQIAAEE